MLELSQLDLDEIATALSDQADRPKVGAGRLLDL